MRYVGYLIVLVLVILGVTFAVLNSDPVTINYYAAITQAPLSVVLAITFAIGVFIGVLGMFFKWMGLRFEIRRLKKQLKQLQLQTQAPSVSE